MGQQMRRVRLMDIPAADICRRLSLGNERLPKPRKWLA